jgi:hypothetical protein
MIDPWSRSATNIERIEIMARTQAKIGGEIGVNGYAYKGGQFLPSTQAEPGKWKVAGKWVKTSREMIAPGQWEVQPTPFSRAIFSIAGFGHFSRIVDGKLVINTGVFCNDGFTPVTTDMEIRPGVRGILGKESLTLGEIIEAWNNGARWFDVQPDADVIKG